MSDVADRFDDWWNSADAELFKRAVREKRDVARSNMEHAVYSKEFHDASRWNGYAEAWTEIIEGEFAREIMAAVEEEEQRGD